MTNPTILAARELYLSECGQSFDRHSTNLKELVSGEGATKLICQNFDVFDSIIRPKKAVPTAVKKSTYKLLDGDVTNLMWFVYWFVTHEMRDDGHPVVYCRDRDGNPCDPSVAHVIQICDGDKLHHFDPTIKVEYITEDLFSQIMAREAELREERNNLRKRAGREAAVVSPLARLLSAFTEVE